ncbi:MAG TPA: ABC transporter ATP-binding protein, partial [Burkholderiaceae bacterium]|nr:ABC transporter ATP-binding protein [Burkholderiaceae bacterium]
RVSVLVSGRVIASAAPGEVRRDPQVIAAYLGQE